MLIGHKRESYEALSRIKQELSSTRGSAAIHRLARHLGESDVLTRLATKETEVE
jgi:hypothetical protein